MNPFKLLIALCVLFVVSAAAQAGPKIERWQTVEGVRVSFVESHALPILDVQVDFAAGSAYDDVGKSGVAALTRGILDLGIPGMDETQIASRLADLGAQISGGVDLDRASVTLRTLSSVEHRLPALDLLRAILSRPQFPDGVFDRERARSVATLKESLTRPDAIAAKAFWAAMYGSHPYGRQATPESVGGLTRGDVVAFHAAKYTASRASIVIVGDLTRAQAETLADQLSAGLPPGVPGEGISVPSLPSAGEQRLVHPALQAHLLLGLPALKRGDPDFFPLLVGNYSLGGGGFVSRLMKEVRDKRGLAYSVHSYFNPLAQLGPFQIGMQTKKDQAEQALAVTRSVLSTFLEEGPSETELWAAKQNLIGSFPLRLDSNRKLLENVALLAFYDLPLDYLDRYPENIEKVTVADIKAAFRRHVPPNHLVTIVVSGD